MGERVAACHYTFSKEEFRRAMRVFWLKTTRGRLTILWLIIICGGGIVLGVASSTVPRGYGDHGVNFFVTNLLPLFIFLPLIGLTIFFQSLRAFRRGPLFAQPISISLSEEQLEVKTPVLESKVKWSALSKWVEGKTGFLVYLMGHRSFYWLPFFGFESPEDIPWSRELLKRKALLR